MIKKGMVYRWFDGVDRGLLGLGNGSARNRVGIIEAFAVCVVVGCSFSFPPHRHFRALFNSSSTLALQSWT
jgi:hypothetical protein